MIVPIFCCLFNRMRSYTVLYGKKQKNVLNHLLNIPAYKKKLGVFGHIFEYTKQFTKLLKESVGFGRKSNEQMFVACERNSNSNNTEHIKWYLYDLSDHLLQIIIRKKANKTTKLLSADTDQSIDRGENAYKIHYICIFTFMLILLYFTSLS